MKSEAPHKVNPDWAKLPLFDRSKWKRVRFGEVVENLNETCDPTEAGIERFIGLEHLEPGLLHIRTWGNTADGTTFTRRCRPGQVLFGKRRAYQRKVAVAEFDAVVSGDIYVVSAKEDCLLPELLPFICLSERFFKFAVETSAGSLSPRTNWSHLTEFEFALPPLDQQSRIAGILWAVDATKEAVNGVSQNIEVTTSAFTEGLFGERSKYNGNGRATLGQVCKLQSGYPFKSSEFVDEGDRLLRGSNVGVNRVDWSPDITRCFPSERRQEFADFILRSGDIVIAMDRPFISEGFKIARITENDLPSLLLQRVGRFQPNENIHLEFLWLYLHSTYFQQQLRLSQQGSDLPHVSRFDIESTKLVVPPLEVQQRLIVEFKQLEAAVRATRKHAESCSELASAIVNSLVN
jgi:type I restriction enzyme S subunit